METKEYLRSIYEYKDGNLIHKKSCNHVKVGCNVGSKNKTGYLCTSILGRKYLVHRVIYMYFHGYLPKYIDHIDGNPLNNSIENLRECTFSENRCNVSKYKNNTTGVKGVSFHKRIGKYAARVQINGNRKSIGYFDTIDEAAEAVSNARNEIHGKFAKNT